MRISRLLSSVVVGCALGVLPGTARAQVLTATVVDAERAAPNAGGRSPSDDAPVGMETPVRAVAAPVVAEAGSLPTVTIAPQEMARAARELHGKWKGLAERYDVARIGERNIGGGMNFYSVQKETALGRQLSQQVEQSTKLLEDPVIDEYVNRIGQQLVRNSDAKVPFTIKVVDSDEVNAFALPGGFFFVNTGLILAADNEAELAGVMAHEIAHVAARHATKNATKSDIWNLASIPLIFVGGGAGMIVRNVAGLAGPMTILKFGRDAEREADLLGVEYAYASGYDPRAMVDLFERLDVTAKKKPGLLAKAFATHPMNAERIARAQQEIAYLLPEKAAYIETTSEFDAIKARLLELEGGRRLHLNAQPGKPQLRVKDQANDAATNHGPVLRQTD